jgi:hypothetical protein
VSVIVAHAKWDEARRETVERLRAQLGDCMVTVLCSEERERPHVWARRCWEAAAAMDESAILLQDDVEVCPRFGATVDAMLEALPATAPIVSLHTTLAVAPSLAFLGERFVRSWWVTTPGYVLRRGVAAQLLGWLDRIPPARVAAWNDDHIVMRFAWANRERWGVPWSTIPALVKHDTRVASTFGYDAHPNRVTNVPWDPGAWPAPTKLAWWWLEESPVEVACPWADRKWFAGVELELSRGLSGEQCWACEAAAAVRVGTVLLCRRCVALSASQLIDPRLAPPPPVWAAPASPTNRLGQMRAIVADERAGQPSRVPA